MPDSNDILTDFEVRLIRNHRSSGRESHITPGELAKKYDKSDSTISHWRSAPQAYRYVPCHPNDDTYETQDAIEFLESLPTHHINGVVTSPPYNKAFRGRGKNANRARTNWVNSKLMLEDYELYHDCLPEEEYIEWQRRFLKSALSAVGGADGEGVILYNIGRKIKDLGEDHRRRIVDGFPIRQTIIWNRGSSNNLGGKCPTIFPPRYELIYVIAGRRWRLPQEWLGEMRCWGDVWNIPFETGNPHPAPFPVALAERMVKVVNGLVCDPFAGSGTVGIAAERLGFPYLLTTIAQTTRQCLKNV